MTIKKINPDTVDYSTFRNWLQELGHKKEALNLKIIERKKTGSELNQLHKRISELQSTYNKLDKDIDIMRSELIEIIPTKF